MHRLGFLEHGKFRCFLTTLLSKFGGFVFLEHGVVDTVTVSRSCDIKIQVYPGYQCLNILLVSAVKRDDIICLVKSRKQLTCQQ